MEKGTSPNHTKKKQKINVFILNITLSGQFLHLMFSF